MMKEAEVTFLNKTGIRVQAQIFTGYTLVSTCLADPGEIHILKAGSLRYDIFFKNGATGWEVARVLGSEANSLTLSEFNRRYTVHEVKDHDPLDLATKPKSAA